VLLPFDSLTSSSLCFIMADMRASEMGGQTIYISTASLKLSHWTKYGLGMYSHLQLRLYPHADSVADIAA